jgi:hypothetical protein
MVAVAAVAALLTWAITRPYPVAVEVLGVQFVEWSDGRVTIVRSSSLKMVAWRGNSWFTIIDWPDGGTSYYLVVR